MASPARSGFPARTNSRLDAFLRRHLPPEVYDAVRAYEPCIVVSEAEKHTFRYVVLSDRLIYLTENPPKSIRRVVALRDVVAIDLIDDYPEFLNSPDREINQHIRIVYSSKVLKKECGKPKGVGKFLFPLHHSNVTKKVKQDNNGPTFWRRKDPRSRNESSLRSHQASSMPFKDSTPCPPDLTLSLPGQGTSRPLPALSRTLQSTAASACSPPFVSSTEQQEPPDYKDAPKEIPLRLDGNRNECHVRNSLPASPSHSSSSLEKEESELHLYVISETSSIFLHLKSSWNNYIIRATLPQDPLCSGEQGLVIGNPKPYRGTLLNLLVILVSKPKLPKSCSPSNAQLPCDSTSADISFDAQLQALILEYTDTATALLYEILLVFQQGNLGLGSTKFAISWMMSFLQSCPPTMAFVASIVKRVVKGLSASLQLLTPCQAVLLYQQFYILKSCLLYSKALAEYLRSDHSEEFRYFIHMPALEKRLPVCYPITEPTTQLCHEVLQLIEQKQYAKF
ncbi:uncharacterized protein C12orf56 homolog [Onychomys torridus]|uniref:uncharacterized protein C12orf56 homolog n=1 Tax=Onychomys torridus TaxID=38674 RepID=UPI00167FA0C2|nr:uncharacterized protein C12orf56 homolog [Onychomys torridus]